MFTIFSKKTSYPLNYLLGFEFNNILFKSVCRLSNEHSLTLNSELFTRSESKLAVIEPDKSVGEQQPTNCISKKAISFEALLSNHNIPKKIQYALIHNLNYKLDQTIQSGNLTSLDKQYTFLKNQEGVTGFDIKDFIFDLQARDLTPVFVFPEKSHLYSNNKKELNRLVKRGVTFQIDWLSLTGFHGKIANKTATYLLEIEAVKFIGFERQNLFRMAKTQESQIGRKVSKLLDNQLFS